MGVVVTLTSTTAIFVPLPSIAQSLLWRMARCDRKANPKAIPSFRVSYLDTLSNYLTIVTYWDSISLSMTLFPSMANFILGIGVVA